jgi:hypothetical protein
MSESSRKSMEQFAFNYKAKRSIKQRKSKRVQCKADRKRQPSEFILHCIAVDSEVHQKKWIKGNQKK